MNLWMTQVKVAVIDIYLSQTDHQADQASIPSKDYSGQYQGSSDNEGDTDLNQKSDGKGEGSYTSSNEEEGHLDQNQALSDDEDHPPSTGGENPDGDSEDDSDGEDSSARGPGVHSILQTPAQHLLPSRPLSPAQKVSYTAGRSTTQKRQRSPPSSNTTAEGRNNIGEWGYPGGPMVSPPRKVSKFYGPDGE